MTKEEAIITLKDNICSSCYYSGSNGIDSCSYKECDNYKAFKALEQSNTGRWINGNPICPCYGENKFKDLDADIWADWQPKYCPNCGVRMIEPRESEDEK